MVESEKMCVLEVSPPAKHEVLHPVKEPAQEPRRSSRRAREEEALALDRMRQQALVVEELLAGVLPQTDTWLETLRAKASFSMHLRFTGQLLPLFGGAAFLTELTEGNNALRYVLGLLTFLSSILGLISQHAERTLLQGRTASELLPQLVETRALGERLRRELGIWRRLGQNLELGQELIHEAHDVNHRLNTLGPLIGSGRWRGLIRRFRSRPLAPARA